MGFWVSQCFFINNMAFARHPPRTDTSHDGELVRLVSWVTSAKRTLYPYSGGLLC